MGSSTESRFDLTTDCTGGSGAIGSQDRGNQHDPGNSRARTRVILVAGSLQATAQLGTRLQSMCYAVAECAADDLPVGPGLEAFEAILIATAPRSVENAFKVVHRMNEWRFSPSATPFPPDLVVVAMTTLPTSTAADFRAQCCHLVYDTPGQLAGELEIIVVERNRLREKGALLLFVNSAGSMPAAFLIGMNGQRTEMDLNGREMRLLKELASERRAFVRCELADAVGCSPNQIRIYIERLKAEYERCRSNLGILMRKDEFIKNPGHGLGYRLHARIKRL